ISASWMTVDPPALTLHFHPELTDAGDDVFAAPMGAGWGGRSSAADCRWFRRGSSWAFDVVASLDADRSDTGFAGLQVFYGDGVAS
ncbi:hypothetical protein AVEN_267420-1, partial [Araneus ventricosus]